MARPPFGLLEEAVDYRIKTKIDTQTSVEECIRFIKNTVQDQNRIALPLNITFSKIIALVTRIELSPTQQFGEHNIRLVARCKDHLVWYAPRHEVFRH